MSSYPLTGFGSRPVGDPPLDPPDVRPRDDNEPVARCTSPIPAGRHRDGTPYAVRCSAPIYRDAAGHVDHVRGPQGEPHDLCPGATA